MTEQGAMLARVIRLDDSDLNVFDPAADIGEWAISGAFAFSDWTEADLVGKARQAFANGWLGLDSFGRSTFVAVAPVTAGDLPADWSRTAGSGAQMLRLGTKPQPRAA